MKSTNFVKNSVIAGVMITYLDYCFKYLCQDGTISLLQSLGDGPS